MILTGNELLLCRVPPFRIYYVSIRILDASFLLLGVYVWVPGVDIKN